MPVVIAPPMPQEITNVTAGVGALTEVKATKVYHWKLVIDPSASDFVVDFYRPGTIRLTQQSGTPLAIAPIQSSGDGSRTILTLGLRLEFLLATGIRFHRNPTEDSSGTIEFIDDNRSIVYS